MSVNVNYIAVIDNDAVGTVVDKLNNVLNQKNDTDTVFDFVVHKVSSEDFGKTVVELSSLCRFVNTYNDNLYLDFGRLNALLPEIEKLSEVVEEFNNNLNVFYGNKAIELFYLDENSSYFSVEFDDVFEQINEEDQWVFVDQMSKDYPTVDGKFVNELRNIYEDLRKHENEGEYSEVDETVVETYVDSVDKEFDKIVVFEVFYVFEGRGMKPGSFVESLIETIVKADAVNKSKLYLGFPDYVNVVSAYQNSVEKYNEMSEIVKKECDDR